MSSILFLGGVGRSGTTLLERTLSTSPEVVALGEMVHLWDRGVGGGEPCGCGAPFTECPFWHEVGMRAFGGWEKIDLASITRDRRQVDRNRYILLLAFPRLAPRRFRNAHARLVDVLNRVYRAIGEVAADGGRAVVLVDSSKHPSYLFLLRALPDHDVRLLHVVRDPRGVALSWSKHVERPESGDAMERLGTVRASARWISHNLLFHLAGLLGIRRRRLSYEQFTASPRDLVTLLDRLAGDELSDRGRDLAIDETVVLLGTDHTVSGNPMRFRSGAVAVRADDRWRTEMPSLARVFVSVVTTPLRQVYSR